MTTVPSSISITIPNPTAGQLAAIADIMNAVEQNTVASEAAAKPKKTRSKPEKTVSEDEEEDFGKKEIEAEDLDDDGEDEEEEINSDGEEEDEAPPLSFDDVKAAINKYGEKKPDDMLAILHGFNIKSTKELQKHKSKWEPVYRKVMVKLKKK